MDWPLETLEVHTIGNGDGEEITKLWEKMTWVMGMLPPMGSSSSNISKRHSWDTGRVHRIISWYNFQCVPCTNLNIGTWSDSDEVAPRLGRHQRKDSLSTKQSPSTIWFSALIPRWTFSKTLIKSWKTCLTTSCQGALPSTFLSTTMWKWTSWGSLDWTLRQTKRWRGGLICHRAQRKVQVEVESKMAEAEAEDMKRITTLHDELSASNEKTNAIFEMLSHTGQHPSLHPYGTTLAGLIPRLSKGARASRTRSLEWTRMMPRRLSTMWGPKKPRRLSPKPSFCKRVVDTAMEEGNNPNFRSLIIEKGAAVPFLDEAPPRDDEVIHLWDCLPHLWMLVCVLHRLPPQKVLSFEHSICTALWRFLSYLF